MPRLVASLFGFGDCMLNTPLTRELARHWGDTLQVAVRPGCEDAFQNLPWIEQVVLTHAVPAGAVDLTQYTHFWKMGGSLLDIPRKVGRRLGLGDFDQRPLLLPTGAEFGRAWGWAQRCGPGPLVAVEGVYRSGQSWADEEALAAILRRHDRVLWLCNEQPPPARPGLDLTTAHQLTRRELLLLLGLCDVLYSVGSGFFCGSLALREGFDALPPATPGLDPRALPVPLGRPPRRTICLWKDDLYKYEARLAELGWRSIEWIHNRQELEAVLSD